MILLALAALFAVQFLPGTVQAQGGYRLNPGDVLAIEVLEDSSLNREVLVLPDGSFNFPFAGSVQASGRTTADIQGDLVSGIASNFANPPNVFVTVRQLRPTPPPGPTASVAPAVAPTIDIYFLGEVTTPGLREVSPGTTILQALSQSGGFTNFAALRRIQLRRTDPRTGRNQVVKINYRAISDGAVLSNDFALADGDVIVVPERRLFE
ncbi:MAG: polysaccharide biosynthesis/export family protein [Litorimonas sp.]